MQVNQLEPSSFDNKLYKAAKILDKIERGFNVPGNVPGVALISGPLRALFGLTEAVGGAAIGTILAIGSAFCKNKETAHKMRDLSKFSLQLMEAGALNICRGIGAEAVATGFLVIGMFPMWHVNHDCPNGKFMPYVSNTEIVDSVIDDRCNNDHHWYSPLVRQKYRVITEIKEQLRL